MSRTASIRITRTTDETGTHWHRMTIEIGAQKISPPAEFVTLTGLCTLLADILAEELSPSTCTTAPDLEPVKP